MIRVQIDLEEDMIKNILITGDFFIHPEEAVESLEAVLRGAEVNEEGLLTLIRKYVEENRVEILGASPEDFVAAIMKATKRT